MSSDNNSNNLPQSSWDSAFRDKKLGGSWKFAFQFLNQLVEQGDLCALEWILQNADEYFGIDHNKHNHCPIWYGNEALEESLRSPPHHPIWQAVHVGADLSILQCLVEKGGCIPLRPRDFQTILQKAREQADEPRLNVVDYLQSIVNLLNAVQNQSHVEMEQCLHNGAPANLSLQHQDAKQHGDMKFFLVHLTFCTGDATAAQMLLDHGAKLHALDLHVALKENHHVDQESFLHWLCRHDAVDVNAKWQNATPLEIAVKHKRHVFARVLLEEGTHIMHPADNLQLHKCVLFQASDNNDVDMVRLLLRHGATATLQSDTGWSTLHHAARRGYGLIVQAIVAHHWQRQDDEDLLIALGNILWGCSRTNDTKWRSPLQYAVDGGHLDIVQSLIVPRIVQLKHG